MIRDLKIVQLISGAGTKSQRLFNAGCFIAVVFCILSVIESSIAGLSSFLIAGNALYSITLAFLYYLSRIKQKHAASRFLGIVLLVFLYTPMLWFFNGGSSSGIPYFLVMFISFLVILTIDDNNSRLARIFSIAVLVIDLLVVTGIIYVEYAYPETIYKFTSRSTQYFDMAAGMIIAILGNFFILKAFVVQHHRDLAEIKLYSQQLEALVQVDLMTDLFNHSHAIDRLDAEVKKALRYNRPLSLIMIDLDHFKRINDTYGHQFGDEVIIAAAKVLKKSCRNVDIPARYGGDEYLLILPETSAEAALAVAERVRSSLRNLSFSHPVSVTISGGIVRCIEGDSAREMIMRADALLYKIKKAGRNCVRLDWENQESTLS